MRQRTLKKAVEFNGIGLHSGVSVRLSLAPTEAGTGIRFVRTDVMDRNNIIPARWDQVVDTRLCTVLGNAAGVTVATIEHLMAALRGADIHNVEIRLDGPEVPAMDGSAAPFLEAIDAAGVAEQDTPVQAIKVLRPIEVREGEKIVRLTPAERARFSGAIDFNHPIVGAQEHQVEMLNGNFRHEIAAARTFGFREDVQAMQAAGLALGGSLDNAIVIDRDRVMNPEGLRFADEFIRHKLLDAIGDLYLAGMPIVGAYHGVKAGHAMNNALLRAFFAQDGAWELVPYTAPAKVLA